MNQQITVEQLDKIGFWASTVCAIHCGAVPLVLTIFPLLGVRYLTDPRLEWWMIALSATIATSSLVAGYRKHHRRLTAIVVFGCGITLLILGRTVGAKFEHISAPIGATGIAVCHVVNYRLCKWCKVCR
jgi:hypothetical protein